MDVREIARDLVQGVVGAIADMEQFVATDRARRLQTVIGWLVTLCTWLAWAWLAVLLFHLATGLITDDPRPLAAGGLVPREAVFAVLGIAIVGPIVIVLAAMAMLFGYRLLVDALSRRLPRAFKLLASPAILFAVLAAAWAYRTELRYETMHYYRELQHVLEVAAQFNLA